MSDEKLKIKFPWKRHMRTRPIVTVNDDHTPSSKTAKSMKKVKERNKEKCTVHGERKRANYINIEDRSDDQQEAQRRK